MKTPWDPNLIGEQAALLQDELIALRRHFYAHPELSDEEQETACTIAAYLEALGLEVETGIGGHGVTGCLQGARPGPTIAYRAEMDALPITDTLTVPYASLKLGVKHACGHDAHATMALGAAKLLAHGREYLPGKVVFLFQPAEESLDGAQAMLQEGVLDRHGIEAILAFHAFPLPVGSIGVNTDLCLAGMEEFRVRFYAPDGDLGALVAHAITALEALSTAHAPTNADEFSTFLWRMKRDPTLRHTVFLSCEPHTQGSVPPYHLLGLVSITDFALRSDVQTQIRQTLDRVTADHGATYDLVTTFSNPPLINDRALVEAVTPVLEQVVGATNVHTFRHPYPFSHEDFARYAERVPVVLLWLGTANPEREIASLLHTPDYDIDEAALVIGTHAATAMLTHLLRTGLP